MPNPEIKNINKRTVDYEKRLKEAKKTHAKKLEQARKEFDKEWRVQIVKKYEESKPKRDREVEKSKALNE